MNGMARGTIDVRYSLCTGCRACEVACSASKEAAVWPAAAIIFHPVSRKPLFCDLCGGDPACVKACAPEAITYLPGSSFDGRHYARNPEEIAADLALGLYGSREVS